MSYKNDESKSIRFDRLMYSEPEHLVFSYSPEAKHLRLLELEKSVKNYDNNGEADYFQHSFHLRDISDSQNKDDFIFVPKRCMMFDNQLTVIQKKQQGEPINYHKTYGKHINEQLSKMIFHWYFDHQQLLFNSNCQLFKQYYFYQEINSFCFGRKHFVRSLNSIQLSSDHISRNHCQLMIQKGKTKDDMQRYFELIFGITLNKKNKAETKERRKEKLSKGNKILQITKQLWLIIYSYIFLSKDKYYLVDNGSRNGTFFIECFHANKTQQLKPTLQYDLYGQKIIQNHKLTIKQGYSYQFEGEEYLMKIWRLTQRKVFSKISQKLQMNEETQEFKINDGNEKTIKYIEQFEQKINWFNNFQKVNKEFIIDDNLLRRNLWKGRRCYEEMILKQKNRKQNQTLQSGRRNNQVFQQQSQFQSMQRVNMSNQLLPFSQNRETNQNLNITKTQFVQLIHQQFLFQNKLLQKYNIQINQLFHSPSNQFSNQQYQTIFKKIPKEDFNILKKLFINQYQFNTIVLSLDFSNDFKKLYCLITQTNKPNKFHLGSQMIINTARFQFEQNQKCNGYIQFDGTKWNLIALTSKVQNQQNTSKNLKNTDLKNDESNDYESDLQELSIDNKFCKEESREIFSQNKFARKSTNQQKCQNLQQKKCFQMNLYKKLSNKIWTKIPATSLYELNPQKCQNYLIRLAHSFYFQLKFINFTTKPLDDQI